MHEFLVIVIAVVMGNEIHRFISIFIGLLLNEVKERKNP